MVRGVSCGGRAVQVMPESAQLLWRELPPLLTRLLQNLLCTDRIDDHLYAPFRKSKVIVCSACYDMTAASTFVDRTCVYVRVHLSVVYVHMYVCVSRVFLILVRVGFLLHGIRTMSDCSAAILARAEVVRRPQIYLGFAEWIAWGWDNKTRVRMLLGPHVHGVKYGFNSPGRYMRTHVFTYVRTP